MITPVSSKETEPLQEDQPEDDNRRKKERRSKYAEGYMYISTVGWICRRERKRRKPDESEKE
jgi:hypothetical protein